MYETELDTLLLQVKHGDELSRERLIRHYKSFIIHTVGHTCKRFITWSDEESSLALIAFNRAIDTFQPESGRTFLNYAFLLIQRTIIDFYRKEKREKVLSLSHSHDVEEDGSTYLEEGQTLESYFASVQSAELVEEILELDQHLEKFGISFEELENYSPSHTDTRVSLMEMALEFVKHQDLISDLVRTRRFPTAKFVKKTTYHPKKIEKFRKYLITLVIMLMHPEWVHLSTFIQLPSRSEGCS
jgi:RNA polymerase sigma factor